eukprot:TRINITY_DN42897_c0_g1_i1.p1 TRINITY_DN42897_c0_g1~~TRINITY_DN42897_c0_g1_i1.p1  ORF type:complete len:1505 (-),score=208.77 TRINITY_DN42897_c0_g1_i1:175-4620(-)
MVTFSTVCAGRLRLLRAFVATLAPATLCADIHSKGVHDAGSSAAGCQTAMRVSMLLPPRVPGGGIARLPINLCGGCYDWKSQDENLIRVELPEPRPACVSSVVLASIAENVHGDERVAVTATPPTGEPLNFYVHLAPITRIEVETRVRRMFVDEEEELTVMAYDRWGSVFSSLEGIEFSWNLGSLGHFREASVPLAELSLPRRQLVLQSKQTDAVILHGSKIGTDVVSVALMNYPGGALQSPHVKINVVERLIVSPSRSCLPEGAVMMPVLHVSGRIGDVKEVALPSEHFKWFLRDAADSSVLSITDDQRGHTLAIKQGHSRLVVKDLRVNETSADAMIHVENVARIRASTLPWGGEPQVLSMLAPYPSCADASVAPDGSGTSWQFVLGRTYAVRLELLDKTMRALSVTDNLVANVSSSSLLRRVRADKTGAYILVEAIAVGQGVLHFQNPHWGSQETKDTCGSQPGSLSCSDLSFDQPFEVSEPLALHLPGSLRFPPWHSYALQVTSGPVSFLFSIVAARPFVLVGSVSGNASSRNVTVASDGKKWGLQRGSHHRFTFNLEGPGGTPMTVGTELGMNIRWTRKGAVSVGWRLRNSVAVDNASVSGSKNERVLAPDVRNGLHLEFSSSDTAIVAKVRKHLLSRCKKGDAGCVGGGVPVILPLSGRMPLPVGDGGADSGPTRIELLALSGSSTARTSENDSFVAGSEPNEGVSIASKPGGGSAASLTEATRLAAAVRLLPPMPSPLIQLPLGALFERRVQLADDQGAPLVLPSRVPVNLTISHPDVVGGNLTTDSTGSFRLLRLSALALGCASVDVSVSVPAPCSRGSDCSGDGGNGAPTREIAAEPGRFLRLSVAVCIARGALVGQVAPVPLLPGSQLHLWVDSVLLRRGSSRTLAAGSVAACSMRLSCSAGGSPDLMDLDIGDRLAKDLDVLLRQNIVNSSTVTVQADAVRWAPHSEHGPFGCSTAGVDVDIAFRFGAKPSHTTLGATAGVAGDFDRSLPALLEELWFAPSLRDAGTAATFLDLSKGVRATAEDEVLQLVAADDVCAHVVGWTSTAPAVLAVAGTGSGRSPEAVAQKAGVATVSACFGGATGKFEVVVVSGVSEVEAAGHTVGTPLVQGCSRAPKPGEAILTNTLQPTPLIVPVRFFAAASNGSRVELLSSPFHTQALEFICEPTDPTLTDFFEFDAWSALTPQTVNVHVAASQSGTQTLPSWGRGQPQAGCLLQPRKSVDVTKWTDKLTPQMLELRLRTGHVAGRDQWQVGSWPFAPRFMVLEPSGTELEAGSVCATLSPSTPRASIWVWTGGRPVEAWLGDQLHDPANRGELAFRIRNATLSLPQFAIDIVWNRPRDWCGSQDVTLLLEARAACQTQRMVVRVDGGLCESDRTAFAPPEPPTPPPKPPLFYDEPQPSSRRLFLSTVLLLGLSLWCCCVSRDYVPTTTVFEPRPGVAPLPPGLATQKRPQATGVGPIFRPFGSAAPIGR